MNRAILLVLILTLSMIAGVAKADFTFGVPTKVFKVSTPYRDCDPDLSADGLELYFNSRRPGGSGNFDLWVARRAASDEDWEQPENLGPTVNDPTDDHDSCISADGLTLYFSSYNRSGGRGGDDLRVTRRSTINDPWETPVNLESSVNSSNDDMDPSLSTDGQELYFCSDRPGGHGDFDIWIATRQTSERLPEGYWSIPINLGANVNTQYSDHSPSLSSDGLALFFCSNRPGGYGSRDLWMTTRPTRDDDWGEPVNLGPNVNSSAWDDDPDISSDGLWLFYNFDIGSENLWQAPIMPIVDLNNDGIVDAADMVIMVDNWGTDNSLCDIGPMPWGDGVVDVQDLIVLAEHLFEEIPPAQ